MFNKLLTLPETKFVLKVYANRVYKEDEKYVFVKENEIVSIFIIKEVLRMVKQIELNENVFYVTVKE